MTFAQRQVWHAAFLPPLDLPERFRDAQPTVIGNPVIRSKTLAYISKFWEEAERGIAPAFIGHAGQWKTYAACVIARYTNHVKVPTRFVECGPFFLQLDAQFYQAGGMRAYNEVRDVAFLVLDDFTQVKRDTRGAELMANLLGERFSAKLPTMLTGNIGKGGDRIKAAAAVSEHYRPDFARRMVHGAGAALEPIKEGYYVVV